MDVPHSGGRSAPTSKPMVSIITPVLNRASAIARCLESVAGQSYSRIEHIVVDGGSTDGTLDLLQSFDSATPLRWVSEEDDGMYDAINRGIALAKGDILAYLNSDDLYLPWSIEVAVDTLERGADLIYGDLGVIKRLNGSGSRFHLQFYPPFDLRYYTHTGSVAQPTAFWKRTLTEKVGDFDASYRLIGDCEYWLRAAASGANLAHVDEVLAVQFDHGDTLRATQASRLREEFERIRTRYADHAPPPVFPKLRRLAKSARWRRYQWAFLLACARRSPRKWPRFVAFLRSNDIEVNPLSILVLYMLPGKLRPRDATWVNASRFEEKILEEFHLSAAAPAPPEPR
jgi:glycosyltransferase involved in cell wall biosynthesis